MRLKGLRAIRAAKIAEYLLCDDHPTGGPKSRYFKSFGFSETDPITFEAALLRHPSENDVWKTAETDIGTKSIVVCQLNTPDGRNPCVRTIWFKPIGSTAHRLVSAYPGKP